MSDSLEIIIFTVVIIIIIYYYYRPKNEKITDSNDNYYEDYYDHDNYSGYSSYSSNYGKNYTIFDLENEYKNIYENYSSMNTQERNYNEPKEKNKYMDYESENILTDIRNNLYSIMKEYGDIKDFKLKTNKERSFVKGKKIMNICVRSPEYGYIFDMNTLMYVAIHELAHIYSSTIDIDNKKEHSKEFKSIEYQLLNISKRLELYNENKTIDSNYPEKQ